MTLWPYFFLSFFLSVALPLPLLPFSPFFALLFRRRTFLESLWLSAGCGFLLDLLVETPFGLHTLICPLVAALLYRYHIYFIDKPIGLALYTFIISSTLAVVQRLSFLLWDPKLPWSFLGGVTDFFILPLMDGVLSLVCFSFPLILYRFVKSRLHHFQFISKKFKRKREDTAHAE